MVERKYGKLPEETFRTEDNSYVCSPWYLKQLYLLVVFKSASAAK